MKTFVISPSELSYVCDHCAYIGKNFNLYPKMISAGVTQTLDSMEKEYFLGDVKKKDCQCHMACLLTYLLTYSLASLLTYLIYLRARPPTSLFTYLLTRS